MSFHKCHAFMCDKPVQPRMLMCKKHWAMVPTNIQVRIKTNFHPDQCSGKIRPSMEWLKASREAINFITKAEGNWEVSELMGSGS